MHSPNRRRACDTPHVVGGGAIGPEVVRRIVTRVLRASDEPGSASLEERIQETIYCEAQRALHAHAGPRATDDRRFLARLRHDLAHADEDRRRELVLAIVDRYVAEIGGRFNPCIYGIATHAVPTAFDGLLGGLAWARGRGARKPIGRSLDDRIRLEGEVAALRSLARRGTIVLAPCHVSNLDSVVLGWAIDRLELPPFAYGAGLNLFSNPVIGFFMRNLGAYTVDRDKSDPLYREALKEYATVLLERGQHSLFFPGGTRSRSGCVERKLKLGLLGTAPIAYQHDLTAREPRRVFVVPCTLTYPLVLEAASLIDEFLRAEGRARYIDTRDEFDQPGRWIDFLRGFAALDLAIHVHFGEPMDVVGNDVDEDGESLDPQGRRIDPRGYFSADEDGARDAEYTRMIAARLLDAYRRDTVALPTSVLAFVVLERLRLEAGQTDLFRFLASIRPDATVPLEVVIEDVGRACEELGRLAARGRIVVSDDLRATAPVVVRRALDTFRTYHARPVVARRGAGVVASDARLLFYYRNRLEGLGLLGSPALLPSNGAVGSLR